METNSPTDSYCNPLDLSYRFQIEGWARESLREAADPSIVWFQDAYWLFASKSGGYWRSPDLLRWTFVPTKILPHEEYAPDVRVINGELFFTASSLTLSTIFKTVDPGADAWTQVSQPLVYWDPHMFQDDDGRTYLYWGCSNDQPIHGVEMSQDMTKLIGEPVDLFRGAPQDHGWERCLENNKGPQPPYVEGAWMNKIGDKYYLQYSAPGTEWNVYGDGVYMGEAPLGPYTYAQHNPFSFKPGGFARGAGHGSTFTDAFGNLWHASTMGICVKHDFERRMGLFPAGIDEEGNLFCNTSFGDYPTRVPKKKWDPLADSFCGWMLLSYRKPSTASSWLAGFPKENAFNENIRTFWSAGTKKAGEWLMVDLEKSSQVHAIQINFYEHDCDCHGREGEKTFHQFLLESSDDGIQWKVVHDARQTEADVPHGYFVFAEGFAARYLRLTSLHMPGAGYFAVSGFRIFGLAPGEKPGKTQGIQFDFNEKLLELNLAWDAAKDATGYNVLWGIGPKKLYNSWLLYEQTVLELRAINRNVPVWVRIDSFNSSGITEGTPFQVA